MFKGCAVWGVADPHAVFGKEEVVEPPVRHGVELPVWNRGKKIHRHPTFVEWRRVSVRVV